VPDQAKTAEVDEIVTFLQAIVQSTDCSLVEEWEALQRDVALPPSPEIESVATLADQVDVTRNEKAFMVLIRNAMFAVLRALHRGDFASALTDLAGVAEHALAARMAEYFEQCGELSVDPHARSPQYLRVASKDEQAVHLEQTLCDAEEPTDWALKVTVDLAESRVQGHPVLWFESLEPVGGH
jgi:hypothetical protein